METIFDKIVRGEIKSWRVWEDDKYLAFLTPFANTPGQTVVIPKVNSGDYVFGVSDEEMTGLVKASKKVAKLLEKAFKTPRVAMVFEGTGVAYVHSKLYPLLGKLAGETNMWSKHNEFYPEYAGYLTTVEGPQAGGDQLDAWQKQIVDAGK